MVNAAEWQDVEAPTPSTLSAPLSHAMTLPSVPSPFYMLFVAVPFLSMYTFNIYIVEEFFRLDIVYAMPYRVMLCPAISQIVHIPSRISFFRFFCTDAPIRPLSPLVLQYLVPR